MTGMGTSTTEPIEVTDASFAEDVLQSSLPVLLDCWAPWCPPCRIVAPAVQQLAADLAGTVKVAKLNVDENPETATRLRIQNIPAFLLFKDGEVIGRMLGAAPGPGIKAAVLEWLADEERRTA